MGIITIIISFIIYAVYTGHDSWVLTLLVGVMFLDCVVATLAAYSVKFFSKNLDNAELVEELDALYIQRKWYVVWPKIIAVGVACGVCAVFNSMMIALLFYVLFVSECYIEYKFQTYK
jgi:hypothetical protein